MPEDIPDHPAVAETDPGQVSLPFLIKLAAALLIYIGLDGISGIIVALTGKDADINLGNLILCVVGFGLLRRNRMAWGCTSFLLALIIAGTVFSLISIAIPSCQYRVNAGTDSLGSAILLAVAIGAVAAIFLFKLTQRDVAATFNAGPKNTSQIREATRFGWIIAIVSVVALSERLWVEETYEDLIEGTFAIDTTFRVFDSQTDEPLNGIIIRGPGNLLTDLTGPHLKMTTRSASEMRYHGYAFAPFTVQVGADGYDEVEVTVDEDTPEELKFSLVKTEPGEPSG